MTNERFDEITGRLRLPLVAAPMFQVSGPDLVVSACRAGIVGSFPVANARNTAELDRWLDQFADELGPADGPVCPNLIVRHEAIDEHVASLVRHDISLVITSVGPPTPVIGPLHEVGCQVLADVASLHHARRAVEAGADGLVLLTAGAGGQTGWANGFAFVRAVRQFYDGPVVLAGGISDGHALFAARALGADLAYMGTRFIATRESDASDAYKAMLVTSELDDVLLTAAVTGLPTSILRPSLTASGLDPDDLPEAVSEESARELYGAGAAGPRRWRDIWSAGHTVSGVGPVRSVQALVDDVAEEYHQARLNLG